MPAGHGILQLQRVAFFAIAAIAGQARRVRASVCDVVNLTLETCPPGTWKNEWSGAPCEWYNCVPCPQGRYTDQANRSACQECPGGHAVEQATGCTQCPGGRFAEPGDAACRPCQRGDFAPAGSRHCQTCPAGTRTGREQTHCVECPAGRYSEYASSNCTRCPRGEYSRPGAVQCEPCAAGSVVDPGSDGCTACPAGTFLSFGGLNCTPCPPGTVSAEGSSVCEPCPLGTSPDLERSECGECPPGMRSLEGWPVCELCPNGTYAVMGVECEQCPAGETPVANKTGCEQCPNGRYSEPGWIECVACPNGTVSYPGMAMCEGCLPGYEPDPGHATCVPCGAGTYSGYEMDTCRPCPAATYSVAGSSECRRCAVGWVPNASRTDCERCDAGTIAPAGSEGCQVCPGGTFQRDGKECAGCPVGQWSPDGSTRCAICAEGWVPSEAQDSCEVCSLGTYAAHGAEQCELDLELAVALEACSFLTFVVVFILASYIRRVLKVEDIERFGEKVVVTTQGNHRVGQHRLWRKCKGTVRARLVEGTGNRCLDGLGKGFRVRVLDPRRMELAQMDGSPIPGGVDASQGALRLDFRSEFFCYGESLPVVLISVVLSPVPFLIPFFNERLYPLSWLFAIAIVLSLLLAVSSAFLLRWWRYRSPTLIEMRVEQFRKQLLEGNPTPQSCEHSFQRAVSAKQLVDLHDFFQDFIRSRNAYYLNPNVTKPLTKPYRLSYAELAGPRRLMYFVSHFWGTPFGHFVETVRKHANTLGPRAWEATSYWVCFLSNNQWALGQELGSSWKESSFYRALRSGCCRGTCMVLDSEALPLSRSWCLFEVLQSYQLLHQSRSQFEGLVFCTEKGVIGAENDRCFDITIALASRLTNLHAQDATASNPADQAMIEKCVEEELGGMEALNVFIRKTMLGDLNRATDHFARDIDMVKGALRAEAGDSTP